MYVQKHSVSFLNKDFLIDLEGKWLQFKKNRYDT